MAVLTKDEILKKISALNISLPGGQAGIAFEYFLERPDVDVDEVSCDGDSISTNHHACNGSDKLYFFRDDFDDDVLDVRSFRQCRMEALVQILQSTFRLKTWSPFNQLRKILKLCIGS